MGKKIKSDQGDIYDEKFFTEYDNRKGKFLLKILSDLEKPSILDIGGGRGHLYEFLLDNGYEVEYVTLDISKEQVKEAKKRGINAINFNIEKGIVPLDDNKFDLVVLTEVIEHVMNTEHLLSEIERLLKPSGLLYLTTPNIASLGNRIQMIFGKRPGCIECKVGMGHGHIRAFVKKDLIELCDQAGLQVKKIKGKPCEWNKVPNILLKIINPFFITFPTLSKGFEMIAQKQE